ncbi:MAG: peptidoglycan bridge formation glycyltransferase FemA/FemB family protein [Anaerolineae bacterium]|nr:peptidoglycan bridge formation glycyltransferase FemA/FemB family protein [Anaerolineae bacterium]MDW8069548.1 peptidoglycan bridge formation glycyltransferase FemA/FemB family protein [Anaerolineae bacterium]
MTLLSIRTDPREICTDLPASEWDSFVAAHPCAHILQTAEWGELKSAFGWKAERVALLEGGRLRAGALVLYRRLPAGLGSLAYIPRGPLVDWQRSEEATVLVEALSAAARAHRAIALIAEPDLPDEPGWRVRLTALGFRPSPLGSVQPRRTLVVDISRSEGEILAAMKPKTRYNIRLAERKGVVVWEGAETDLPAFHRLMMETAARDRFRIHPPAYYERAYRLFVPQGWARLLMAGVEGEPVAALMVFALGPRAWYFYGASANAHREKMPTYRLQWEAMRWARSQGCVEYDLWGVPDKDEECLEAEFSHRQDGLWGVYRFKRGFGGRLVRMIGAWERPLHPALYRLYAALAACWNRRSG